MSVVHDEVGLKQQSRNAELGASDGGPVERQCRSRQGTVGDRDLLALPVQIDYLVTIHYIVRNGQPLAADPDPDHPIRAGKVSGRRFVLCRRKGRIGQRGDPVAPHAAIGEKRRVEGAAAQVGPDAHHLAVGTGGEAARKRQDQSEASGVSPM